MAEGGSAFEPLHDGGARLLFRRCSQILIDDVCTLSDIIAEICGGIELSLDDERG